jgi:hypothetical protein
MLKVDQNLAKYFDLMSNKVKIYVIFNYFDLQWSKLTFKQQDMYIFGINEQFATRKSTISIFSSRQNPDRLPIDQKKNKYAEITKKKIYIFSDFFFRTLEHLRVYLTTEDDIYKVQGFGGAKNQS